MIQKIKRSSWKPFPEINYRRTPPPAPPPAPLARHFIEDPARERLCLRSYHSTRMVGAKQYGHVGQRHSPIIWGSLNDVQFYLVEGEPEAMRRADFRHETMDPADPLGRFFRSRFEKLPVMEKQLHEEIKAGCNSKLMPFLREYILTKTPGGKFVFISDDHLHAASAWILAQDAGILKPNAAIFNVDEHEDNSLGPELRRTQRGIHADVASCCWENMEIANFIEFATRDQFAPLRRPIDPDQVYFVQTDLNGKGIFKATRYWDSGNPAITQQLDGWKTSLEVVERAIGRAKHRSRILSLDLDFFFRHFSPEGPTEQIGFGFEESLQRVIELGRQADFITIATSPNYLLVKNPIETTIMLLERVLSEL